MSRGKFITLEGGEGVGKTTNLSFIQEHLQQHAISVTVTREPGGTALAEKIRQLVLDKDSESISDTTELLLMFAARAQHIQHVIEPALAQGHWVLCDRFTDATYAYQGGGRELSIATIALLEQLVQGELRPDLTLLLDAPIEIGMERAQKRGAFDRFEAEKISFFTRVRNMYLSRAAQQPDRIKVIQANQSLDNVQSDIIDALNDFIN
ncbi:MAG: dTMP kinase [Methylococcales bacterium]|nr:dTMP kinase [Methylococcales bacterium]